MWTLFCNVCIDFLKPNMKGNHAWIEWQAFKCYHVLNCFFPSKTWLFGIYLNFQWQKLLQNQYLPHSASKSYQINSVKSCSYQDLSNNTKGTLQFLRNFQLQLNLIFSEKIIQYSRTCAPQVHGSKAMHPSLLRAFQRHQEHNLKHSGLMDLITTKQNKLPSFIDRYCIYYSLGYWNPISQK